jgi:hypothetical protein
VRRLFEVNSEPHNGARPSVRLCVGPELARCVHLSDDVASPFLPLHLAPGVRIYSSIALRLGGAFEFFGLPPSSFAANNETLQQA